MIDELKNRQNEIRQILGRAVLRLNTTGKEISRQTILDTLHDFIEETDNKNTQLMLQECVNVFILTNGNFTVNHQE